MKIPTPQNTIAHAIDQHHANQPDLPRAHMGVSLLGHHCTRWMWLSFRWAVVEPFPGRIKRLFRRGHMEETTIVQDLEAIGCKIIGTGASQRRVDFGCHVSGSTDGLILRGLPGAEKTKHVLEGKTHSKKSFDSLLKDGLKKSKFQHYIQMQAYMLGEGVDRALYYPVCKDDDRIAPERVKLDLAIAEQYVERGQLIATSERMPEPLSVDPSWYQCKFCAGSALCHGGEPTKEVNCRTCAHSTPTREGTWTCAAWGKEIKTKYQRMGCEFHVFHPDLVPWKLGNSGDSRFATWIIDGKEVQNGPKSLGCFESVELAANLEGCLSGGLVDVVRGVFVDGKVCG